MATTTCEANLVRLDNIRHMLQADVVETFRELLVIELAEQCSEEVFATAIGNVLCELTEPTQSEVDT